MRRKRAEETWWLTSAGILVFAVYPGFALYRSVVDGAIWRGAFFPPVIFRSEKPDEYYSMLTLLGFLTALFVGGAIWHFVAIRRIRRRHGL